MGNRLKNRHRPHRKHPSRQRRQKPRTRRPQTTQFRYALLVALKRQQSGPDWVTALEAADDLGAQPDAIVDEALDQRIAELKDEIIELEDDLDSDEAASRLAGALWRVNANISEIARSLELEHAESPARLDRHPIDCLGILTGHLHQQYHRTTSPTHLPN